MHLGKCRMHCRNCHMHLPKCHIHFVRCHHPLTPLKQLFMTPKSYGMRKPIISRSKHTFSLENSTFFGEFMKGGAPLAMCREHRCSHAHVWGVPLLSYGTLSLTWGRAILVEGKGGSPPPLSMGQLSQDGVGYV
jgi:hypothetical protein